MDMAFCDLEQSMKAVGQMLMSCLDAEKSYMPTRCGNWEVAHDTGRWIEAALKLEASIGMKIPEAAERGMMLNLRALTNNPFGMLINDPEIFPGATNVNFHNPRELLLTLTQLIEKRGSRWARRCGEAMLETMDRRFFERTLTDDDIREELGFGKPEPTNRPVSPYKGKDKTGSTGRAIEGILEYWKATGSEKAKEMLEKTVAFHRAHNLHEDGSAPDWMECKEHVGHNHSYLGTLRGLLRYAIEFGDDELKGIVYRTYKKSVQKYSVSFSGWAPHDLARLSFPNEKGDPLGDHASCADAAYIAYLLAAECGYTELYDDAERLIRARLFRQQMTEGEWLGAWGIFGEHFGYGWTVDVFCSIAATFCRIYDSMIRETEDAVRIGLHFSKDAPAAYVEARRGEKQEINVTMKVKKDLRVRIPAWCPRESLSVTEGIQFGFEGNELVVPKREIEAGVRIKIAFGLPEWESEEETMYSGTRYRLFWKGDEMTDYEGTERLPG